LIELVEAYKNGKNIVPVKIDNASRGFCYERVQNFGSHALSVDCKQFLLENGIHINDLETAVNALLNVVAVDFKIGAHEKILEAQYDIMMDRMHISNSFQRRRVPCFGSPQKPLNRLRKSKKYETMESDSPSKFSCERN